MPSWSWFGLDPWIRRSVSCGAALWFKVEARLEQRNEPVSSSNHECSGMSLESMYI